VVVALSAVLAGAWPAAADAAFVGKREARAYVLDAVPRGAPRVMLRDERAAFFHTAGLWIEPASGCDRADAGAVSCQMRARLLPDAEHRRSNWWPITCSGAVLVKRLADGRLKGSQQNYVCHTVRPGEKPATG
jgi:hypothetical protein